MSKVPDHYSLFGEHKDSYEIHDAKSDRTFHVAKNQLDLSMIGKLSGIKKFADGGKVPSALDPVAEEEYDILANLPEPEIQPSESDLQSQKMAQAMDVINKPFHGVDEVSTAPVLQETPRAPAQELQAQVPQTMPALPSTGMTSGDYGKFQGAMNQQVAGVQGMANAQAQQAQLQEQQYAEFNKKMADVVTNADTKLAALDAENAQLTKDVADYKVDPRRYINNMSTGNKVSAAIALALGGLGSGLTGGPNLAYDQFHKFIQNDIESQKLELGKKENLLSRNLQKYGNLNAATQATMMQQNALLQGQIAQTAAKFGTPMALAKGQMEIGKLKQDQMQLQMQFKQSLMQSSLRDQMLKDNVQMDPNKMAMYINAVVPEKDRNAAREELSMVQGYKSAVNNTRMLFDRAKKIGGIEGNIPLTKKKAEIEAIGAEIYSAVRGGMKGQGAISDQEMESTVKPLIPSATDTTKQVDVKLKSLERLLSNKVQGGAPVLTGYGFPIKMDVPKINPAQFQKAEAWLKANPNDPKAEMVRKKLQGMTNG